MKILSALGILSASILLVGCATNTKEDNYREASFELCNTEVKIYSLDDDGRVRIVCADGSKFALKKESTLDVMRNINIEYCDGEGLGKFSETDTYYLFKCKSGQSIMMPKD